MTPFAVDVAVAVELAERVDLDDWWRLMDGPSHSQPYMHDRDQDALQDLQAWLATRAGDPPSMVSAAVANFRRVLDDLLYVFSYDLEHRPPNSYWVRKW